MSVQGLKGPDWVNQYYERGLIAKQVLNFYIGDGERNPMWPHYHWWAWTKLGDGTGRTDRAC